MSVPTEPTEVERRPDIYTYKVEREYFCEILRGEKTFEVRLNDAGPFRGDILILKEVHHGGLTGREQAKRVGFVLNLSDLERFYDKEAMERYGVNVYSLTDCDMQDHCFLTEEGC